ncbi:MAG TPA: cytochrome c oxidase assembly protein [Tepidisphaeraceae bacterium]|nr:cytochrome c oxidase assembly protein [Tepidisphaeraceae bacterium]
MPSLPLRPSFRLLVLPLLWAAPAALAHGTGDHHDGGPPGPRTWADLPTTWSADVLSWATLAVTGALYAVGLRRLWRGGEAGRGVTGRAVACFAAGWVALFVALVSPVHPWGNVLFSVHMTQHEILMLVAAPLLVLGRPVVVSLKGMPRAWAGGLGRTMNRPAWQAARHGLEHPLAAWVVHAVALWVWHVPALFDAAVRHEFVHFLQHASFFGTALLFWWALFSARRGPAAYGAGVLYLFTTAVHSSVLGALLTFGRALWYRPYADTTASWGLTPLQDQQLGGLIMWVPAGLVYVGAGLAMVARWLRESERLAVARESQIAVEP